MELLGMIASWDFCMFLLGVMGIWFFTQLHRVISKCNPKFFAVACVVIAYLVITYIQIHF